MQIETQKQLKPFNTLSLNAIASHYVQIHSPDELVEALDYAQQHALNVMILSGGSNMLLPAQINALMRIPKLYGSVRVKFGMTLCFGRQNIIYLACRIWR